MERELDALRAEGIEVMAIGPGGKRAAELTRRALKLRYPMFGDPTGTVYERFGFRRLMGVLQQSGTVVIDRVGDVRLAHRTANPAVALRLDDVRRALG